MREMHFASISLIYKKYLYLLLLKIESDSNLYNFAISLVYVKAAPSVRKFAMLPQALDKKTVANTGSKLYIMY